MSSVTIPITNITSTRPAGTIQVGEVIDIILSCAETLTYTDQRPVLQIMTAATSAGGSICGYATFVEGNGTNNWKFEFIVPAAVNITSLTLPTTQSFNNGTVIRGSTGLSGAFILSLPQVGAGSLPGNRLFTTSGTTSGPLVTASTVEINLSGGNYTAGTQMIFTVTYPEPIKFLGFDGGNGVFNNTTANVLTVTNQVGTSMGNFPYFSGNGTTTWKYLFDGGDTLATSVRVTGLSTAHGKFCKLDGTPCTVSLPTHGQAGSFSTTKTIAMTGTVLATPTIPSSVCSISGTRGAGESVAIWTVFNAALTLGTGANPTLAMKDGVAGMPITEAAYVSGSGTSNWMWSCTIPTSARIEQFCWAQFSYNGNTLSYTRRTPQGSVIPNGLNFAGSLRAYTEARSTNVATVLADGEYDAGDVIDVVVTWPFALSWTGGSGPTIPLRNENGSDIGASATYVSGNGTNTWNFSYIAEAGIEADRLRTGIINGNGASFTNTSLGSPVVLKLRDIGINTFVWDHDIELTGIGGENPLVTAKIKTRGFFSD